MKMFEFLGRKNCWMLLAMWVCSFIVKAQNDEVFAIPGQYLIKLRSSETPETLLHHFPSLSVVKPLSRSMNIWLVKGNINQNVLPELKRHPAVQIAQFNHRIQNRAIYLPNDSRFSEQWNLRNTGASAGVRGADISATLAWALNTSNLTKTGDTIVVAVIDNTFDQNHEDLNYFYNYHEIPNNDIDDDGNGFIDDYRGWDVFDNTDSVFVFPSSHSTHIAGIVGAKGNNGIGVSGICPGVKVMAIAGSSEKESEVVEAYDYILEMRKLYQQTSGAKGAFVVSTNTSFGVGSYGAHPADFPIWCSMYDSLGKYGILNAVAGPNSAVNIDVVDDVPSACPSNFAISVTNTTRTDLLHVSAGYGAVSMDLGAPGTQVLSTTPGNNYGTLTGTSMATPHVAGTIAAMFAIACPQFLNNYHNFPDSFALLMRSYLLAGVDTIPSMVNTSTKGRLNMFRAVSNVLTYNCNNCNFDAVATAHGNTCFGDTSGSVSITPSGTGPFTYHWNNGASATTVSPLAAGAYAVTVTQTSSSCQLVRAIDVYDPAPIRIDSIHVVPINNGADGNFVVTASAGKDILEYAIDNGPFQVGKIFVVNTAGPHQISVRNQFGCVVDSIKIMRDVTGIESVNGDAMRISPIPANDLIHFVFNEPQSGIVTIFDAQGRLIMQQEFQNEKDGALNIAELKNGIYLLRFEGTNSKNSTIRISIAHE